MIENKVRSKYVRMALVHRDKETEIKDGDRYVKDENGAYRKIGGKTKMSKKDRLRLRKIVRAEIAEVKSESKP